ncbi:hypothetical protein, partial [Achromobacter insuavis]|uniref:hypothetical protein n=1 Tax=Achromobacter insuavis TaxID=1287735 RepID=UPI001F12C9F1
RDVCRVARGELRAPTTNSLGANDLSIALDFAAATRDSVITNRKTPRKPQKAARTAALRRASPHHSSQARSGILNRKMPRMPPDGRPRGRGG